jgi:dienelactone hydrolase
VGFALDVFGKGVRGASPQENASLIRPFMEDRPMLLRRLRSGVAHAQTLPGVDPDRTAVIGFCFGGLCALDLARSGDPLRAAIAFHGLFDPPPAPFGDAISAKVLALHGWDDPMVPPEKVTALADELSRAGADWQIHAYGNTVHAFTNPAMHAKDEGKAYDERADRRSWRAMTDMLAEALA